MVVGLKERLQSHLQLSQLKFEPLRENVKHPMPSAQLTWLLKALFFYFWTSVS